MQAILQTFRPRLGWAWDIWRPLVDAMRKRRRDRCDRLAFERVDDRTLRDLGIDRSEYCSYYAEAHGLAERSRRHLTC